MELLDLNDYCLIHVLRALNLLDLLNVRETNERLNVLADAVAARFKIFSIIDYRDDVHLHMREPLTEAHVDRVLEYIAPVVEEIDYRFTVFDPVHIPALKRHRFPKLKSLTVSEFSHIKWIDSANVQNLTTYYIASMNKERNSWEEIKLKRYTPKLRSLRLLGDVCDYPKDFFANLNQLTHLELLFGSQYRILDCALQIQCLKSLSVQLLPMWNGSNRVEFLVLLKKFLAEMIPKKTLKALDLRNILCDTELFETVAELHLTSLRLNAQEGHWKSNGFCDLLVQHPFASLQRLEVLDKVKIEDFFKVVEHCTGLKEVSFSMLLPFIREEFQRRMNQLVQKRDSDRPNMEVALLFPLMSIMIQFKLRYYELNYRDPARLFSGFMTNGLIWPQA